MGKTSCNLDQDLCSVMLIQQMQCSFLRPPGLEFAILYLEGSVISFLLTILRGSAGSVQHICTQRWPKPHLISFIEGYIEGPVLVNLTSLSCTWLLGMVNNDHQIVLYMFSIVLYQGYHPSICL